MFHADERNASADLPASPVTFSFLKIPPRPLRQNFIEQDGNSGAVTAFGLGRALGQTAVDGLRDQCVGHHAVLADTDDGITTSTPVCPSIARLALGIS